MYKYIVIILIISLAILSYYLGRKLYKSTHDGFMRDNVAVLVSNMRHELSNIDNIIQESEEPKTPETKKLKKDLLIRRRKLIEDLNLFYGEPIFS